MTLIQENSSIHAQEKHFIRIGPTIIQGQYYCLHSHAVAAVTAASLPFSKTPFVETRVNIFQCSKVQYPINQEIKTNYDVIVFFNKLASIL